MKQNNYTIKNTITTLSPLSHIGESISTNSYLVQEPIQQEDGSIQEVFCYSGNALRGQLRDLMSLFYCAKLGVKLSLDTFHLLMSGGKISGGQSVSLDEIKEYRAMFPILSILGGGIGNQIISGKIKVGNCYPICVEAKPVLSNENKEKANVSYKKMTIEKSFTRFDDGKDVNKTDDLSDEAITELKKGKNKNEVSTQMRFTSELLIAGVELENEITMTQANKVELGAMIKTLCDLNSFGFIGGQSCRGHGKIKIRSVLVHSDGAEDVLIDEHGITEYAERRINAYLEYLDSLKTTITDDKEVQKKFGVFVNEETTD